jgi:HSP20 family protein
MFNLVRLAESDAEDKRGWRLSHVTVRHFRRGRGSQAGVYEPPTDVYETEDSVVVRMEIAGLTPDHFEILLSGDGQALTVSGSRQDPAQGERRKYYTMEIECGEFSRQVRMPTAIDAEEVSATYADGFLQIKLPKRIPPHPSSRRVPIS